MIEVLDGVWIAPEHITMIKESGKDKCLVYFVGQSALEGHVLPCAASDLVDAIDGGDFEDDGEDDGEVDE